MKMKIEVTKNESQMLDMMVLARVREICADQGMRGVMVPNGTGKKPHQEEIKEIAFGQRVHVNHLIKFFGWSRVDAVEAFHNNLQNWRKLASRGIKL